MAKQFADRIVPLDEWICVKVAGVESKPPKPLLLAERDDSTGKMKVTAGGPSARNHAIVVAVGPGRQAPDGTVIPIDPRIKPGATVVFPANIERQRPTDYQAEFEREGLFMIVAHQVMFVLQPEGLHSAISA